MTTPDTALRLARESGGITIKRPHVPKVEVPRVRAEGVHVGPIHSSVAGRTDHLNMRVPAKSYVLPADIVSHFGEGNTNAGFKVLKRAYSGAPYNTGNAPYGQSSGPYGMADGGRAGDEDTVPIVAAGGEWVIPPEHVWHDGGGDIDMGHKVLDAVVLKVRKELINSLKKLPGPKRD